MGKGKATTTEPTEYDASEEAAIEAALDRAMGDYDEDYGDDDDEGPTRLYVEAEIEWAGTYNPRAMRGTTLDGLDLKPVRDALRNAEGAAARAAHARPASSYQAKGWHAQLRALLGSSHGSAAADRAGLAPSTRTVQRWLSTEHAPSKANRERIAEAYGALRTWRVDEARQSAERAAHAVADALSGALRERYGAEIRLRDIQRLIMEP